jgi:hypothetical protein
LNFEKKLAIPPKGNGKFWKNLILKFEKIWPYHQREMKKNEICHRNLKWKNLKIFIFELWLKNFVFEIWNENFRLKFEMKISVWNLRKKWPYQGNEKNWNEEITYFVYATEIKLPIILLYHVYHLCIPHYTTSANCGGIQLILAVRTFHTGPFFNSSIWWYGLPWKSPKNKRSLIYVGVTALMWTIWYTRNGMGFVKKKKFTVICVCCFQGILLGAVLARIWSNLGGE